jgi:hypothetical protein
MKIKIHTKDGIEEREATAEEIQQYASFGDKAAKKEILKSDINKATTLEQIKQALIKYL